MVFKFTTRGLMYNSKFNLGGAKMKNLLGAIVFFSVAALMSSESSALSLNASDYNQAHYQPLNPMVPTPAASLPDGDFTIIDHDLTSTSMLGDGHNDRTSWVFNFQNDHNYVPFLSETLVSAYLTLKLTPKNSLVTTDGVRLDGLDCIGGASECLPSNVFNLVPLFQLTTVQIELLDYYTSSQIRGLYNNNFGLITAQYADDSTISSATLHLTVPEPATMLLFGTGIAGLAGSRIRRKKK